MNVRHHPQDPPNCIQVEPTEGCNLRCGFCAIRGIREATGDRDDLSGPYRFMGLETAATVGRQAARAGWRPRIELAMHGEPTMHPRLPELVALLRGHLPRSPILLTTNALPLLDQWEHNIKELFAAGCSTIAVDDYRPHRARQHVLRTNLPGITVHRYPEGGPPGNPHRRPKAGERRLILIKDISEARDGNHSHLSNQGGLAAPPAPDRNHERCALPFREIAVRWDGSVALCCNDWRGIFKIGNVHETPLSELWLHPALQAARRHLYAHRRDFRPCQGCTHRSYRNGLLPDKLGKQTLPPPDAADDQAIADALTGAPFTAAVPRRWELPISEAR
jgi:radical SAM protein with 4Fe4S-binding SPASM domain